MVKKRYFVEFTHLQIFFKDLKDYLKSRQNYFMKGTIYICIKENSIQLK